MVEKKHAAAKEKDGLDQSRGLGKTSMEAQSVPTCEAKSKVPPKQSQKTLLHIWEKEAIGPRSKISQNDSKSGFAITSQSLCGYDVVTSRS